MQDQSNFQRTSGICGEAGHYRYSQGDSKGDTTGVRATLPVSGTSVSEQASQFAHRSTAS